VSWALPWSTSEWRGFDGDDDGHRFLQWVMQTARSENISVIRLFAHGTEQGFELQPSAGKYNEQYFLALDRIVHEAGEHGIRLILSLTDNWKEPDGKMSYVRWAGKGREQDFWTDTRARQLYKDHVATVLDRTNRFTGRRYKNDPSIFAFNLINEPRGTHANARAEIDAWVGEMARHTKETGAQQMVTVGEEGFYTWGYGREWLFNSSWAMETGQDFIANHAHPDVDYASIHAWPDNWAKPYTSFLRDWIVAHAEDAASLGKPLVVEEFGTVVREDSDWARRELRDPFLRQTFELVQSSILDAGVIRGSLFWEWDFFEAEYPGIYGLHRQHSGFSDHIRPHAKKVSDWRGGAGKVLGCYPDFKSDALAGLVERPSANSLDKAAKELANPVPSPPLLPETAIGRAAAAVCRAAAASPFSLATVGVFFEEHEGGESCFTACCPFAVASPPGPPLPVPELLPRPSAYERQAGRDAAAEDRVRFERCADPVTHADERGGLPCTDP